MGLDGRPRPHHPVTTFKLRNTTSIISICTGVRKRYLGHDNYPIIKGAMDSRRRINGSRFISIIAIASRSSLIVVIIVITAHFLSSWSFMVVGAPSRMGLAHRSVLSFACSFLHRDTTL